MGEMSVAYYKHERSDGKQIFIKNQRRRGRGSRRSPVVEHTPSDTENVGLNPALGFFSSSSFYLE